PLRGTMSGPFRAVGPMSALSVQTELSGNAGAFTYSGTIDYSLPGYGARGRGTMRNLDMRALLGRNDLPRTRLNGAATLDLAGDSLANLAGSLVLAGEVSDVDVVRIDPS